jgi:hypothetical protein
MSPPVLLTREAPCILAPDKTQFTPSQFFVVCVLCVQKWADILAQENLNASLKVQAQVIAELVAAAKHVLNGGSGGCWERALLRLERLTARASSLRWTRWMLCNVLLLACTHYSGGQGRSLKQSGEYQRVPWRRKETTANG